MSRFAPPSPRVHGAHHLHGGWRALGLVPGVATFVALTVNGAVGCTERSDNPPPLTTAGGNPTGGGGSSSSGSSGDNEGGAGPTPCLDGVTAPDASATDFDFALGGGRGTTSISGTFSTPGQPDPNGLIVMSVYSDANTLLETFRAFAPTSKRAYTFRVRNLPATSTEHLVKLRVQIDINDSGTVGDVADYDGYYAASPLTPVMDIALARNVDTLSTCSPIDFALDIVRQ